MAYFSLGKIQASIIVILIFKSIYSFSNDENLARTKAEAINVYAAIRQLDAPVDHAINARQKTIYIYVGSSAESFSIQAAKIQIDDNAPVRYVYSEIESNVLLEGGLHEINRLNVIAGDHRIRAEIVALAKDAGPNSDRIFPSIDQRISVNEDAHIEFELVSDGMKNMLGRAELQMRSGRLSL